MTIVFICLTAIALFPLFSVLFYVVNQGFTRFDLSAFTQLPPPPNSTGGGFANALVGTITIVSIASGLSIPVGVLGAVYLTEFSQDRALTRAIGFAANVLNSVPSILIGVFVYSLVVIPTTIVTGGRYSFSAMAGGIALGIVMLPIVMRNTEESLKQVPTDIKWAAVAVGADPSQLVLGVVIPAALPTIGTGILLAMARAAGETAPLIFTALFNQYWARNLWQPTATLSVLIYEFSRSPFTNQQQLAWTSAMVLSVLIAIISVAAKVLIKKL